MKNKKGLFLGLTILATALLGVFISLQSKEIKATSAAVSDKYMISKSSDYYEAFHVGPAIGNRITGTIEFSGNFVDTEFVTQQFDTITITIENGDLESIELWPENPNASEVVIYNATTGLYFYKSYRYTSVELTRIDLEAMSGNLETYFDIYEAIGYYDFPSQINYYAPQGANIDSNVITLSDTTYTLISGFKFIAGGYLYDTIRLVYASATNTYYVGENSIATKITTNGYYNFIRLEYYDSESGVATTANYRNITNIMIDENIESVYQRASTWKGNLSRIYLTSEPTIEQTEQLSLVNGSMAGYIAPVIYPPGYVVGSIAMENGFTLLATAFSAVASILSIQILPNITIGLLMFLPLVVGIIIFIVWLVKR